MTAPAPALASSPGEFRGTVAADGFLIDVGLVGLDEAQRRVLSVLTEGTRIWSMRGPITTHAEPTNTEPTNTEPSTNGSLWIVVVDRPVLTRSSRTIGLPLVRVDGRLTAATPVPDDCMGDVHIRMSGVWHSFHLSLLVPLDPADWFALGLPVTRLEPLQVAPTWTTSPGNPPAPPVKPDTRARARIGAASKKSAALQAAIASLASGERPRWNRRRRSSTESDAPVGPPSPAHPQRLRSFLAEVVLRSPVSGILARKHHKYLQDLEKQFERGDLSEALRNAISLVQAKSLGVGLSLPARRNSLKPSRHGGGGSGRGVPWGPTAWGRLSDRYRKAAERLENEGRYEEAAFVYVDLLDVPIEAVAMLERHQQWMLAAELAEGHKLDANIRVRLWWKAGERSRAVLTARRNNAFAGAISYLTHTEPEAARELRVQWIRSLSQAGAYVAAVEAAWPDSQLHASVAWAIETGIQLGGPDAVTLRAYRLALYPSEANRLETLTLLRSDVAETRGDRERFILKFSELTCSDPVADREIASACVRSILRISEGNAAAKRQALDGLASRADPVLRGDLPPTGGIFWNGPGPIGTPVTVTLDAPSTVPILDALPLPNGSILVALGEMGSRLLNRSGGVVGQWLTPTHRLVGADHGAKALLLTSRGQATEVHQLDLLDFKLRHWATLRIQECASTYDGSSWIVAGDLGLSVLDTTTQQPTVLWREADDSRVAMIQRSPTSLSARITGPVTDPELWQWELPSFTLRSRVPWVGDWALAGGKQGVLVRSGVREDPQYLSTHHFSVKWQEHLLEPVASCVDGDFSAITAEHDGRFRMHLYAGTTAAPLAVALAHSPAFDIHAAGRNIALFNRDAGQVAVVPLSNPEEFRQVRVSL